MGEATFTKTCPTCGQKLIIHFGFRTWCENCNWNLEDFDFEKPEKGVFSKMWIWLGKRSGKRLLKEAIKTPDLRPRLTFSIVLVYLLALLVHGFTGLIVFIALRWLWLVATQWAQSLLVINLAMILGAILLLIIAWNVRPKFGELPKNAISRNTAREAGLQPLFNLVDRISEAINAPRIDAITIWPIFNAAMGQYGVKGQRVLYLGLPLVITLERQELVALIGHELAHSVNGDPQRTWLVKSAIGSLTQWHHIFRLDKIFVFGGYGLAGMLSMIFQLVLWALSVFSWLAAVLLSIMLYPTMQRAEFRADGLAAQLAGTQSKINTLRKLYLRQSVVNIYNKAVHYPGTRILDEIRERMCDVPDQEWVRIDRLIEKSESRLDATHPTTKDRVVFLQSRPSEMGQISLSTAEFTELMAGLMKFDGPVEQEIRKSFQETRR